MSSCIKVDKDYDLSNIDDGDDRQVGNVFEIPFGKVTYSIDDFFDDLDRYIGNNGENPLDIGQLPITLDISCVNEYEVDNSFGGNVADLLGDTGEVIIKINGENFIPLPFGMQFSFTGSSRYYDGDTGSMEPVTVTLDRISIEAAPGDGQASPISTEIPLSMDDFQAICRSSSIELKVDSSVDKVVFRRDDHFRVSISVVKIGGIDL